MTETEYGIIIASPLPAINLLWVPHKGIKTGFSHPAFGPSTYSDNLEKMQKQYFHSEELPKISFREPTTAESISAATYDFKKMAKPQILDPNLLRLGRIVKTSEGVFANPPKDEQGNSIIDERTLKSLLNGAKKVNGIYLCENDFGFAPYETFTRDTQNYDTFADGGLARVLEHTEEKTAKNLRTIASPIFYKKRVQVWGFDEVKKPILEVTGLYSSGGGDGNWLVVSGRSGYDYDGCVFGVLETGEAITQ